jgi:cholesterol oxidase
MGRDVPNGNMKLTEHGYLDIDWIARKSGPYFERVRAESRRIAEAMDAETVEDNPLWYLRRVITVHPLGGCPMGRAPSEGVVDPYGEVFGCPGLHLADGSVMPGPVGPNPSLTIAALADRFAEAMLDGHPAEGAVRARSAVAGTSASGEAPVGVSFTEEMKGFVAFGESDFDRGFRTGRQSGTALMFHLTITVDDLDRFIADRRHEAVAEGWVECVGAGGRLPVERGVFNLFIDQDGDKRRKRMLYRLHLVDGAGQPLTLTGFKVVEDDPGFDLWADTTTLYTRLLRGHTEPEGDAAAEVVAAGIIHIHGVDFAKQLTTFRAHPPQRVDAVARFGALFAGDLWKVYGPK